MKILNQNKVKRRICCCTLAITILSILSTVVSGSDMMNSALLKIHRPSLINVASRLMPSSLSWMEAFIPSHDISKRNLHTKLPIHYHSQQHPIFTTLPQHQKQQSKVMQLHQSSPQHTSSSSTGYARPLVNWYPGHIAKAERLLSETLKSVDVIIEVRDARAPKATAHPRVAEWTAGRPRVVVLTHVDMVPKKSLNMWKTSYEMWGAGKWDGMVDKQVRNQALQNLQEREKYNADGTEIKKSRNGSTSSSSLGDEGNHQVDITSRVEDVLFLDAKRGTGIHSLHRAIYKAGSHVNERRLRRGLNERPLRVGVIGYPNVGKSALINKILGRKRARSANTPGITRSLQWIRVRTDTSTSTSSNQKSGKSKREFELLDSPGIIPSHMIDQSDAFLLAACNSIGDAAYDNQIIAGYLCEWVKTLHVMGKGDATAPQWRAKCLQRYGFDPLVPYNYNVYPTANSNNKSTASFTNEKNNLQVEKRIMSGEDMLYRVADECCKGDVENAARKILQDYRSGRWGPVSLQLAPESEEDEGQAKVSIMSSILNDRMGSGEEEERLRLEMVEEREKRAKVAMEMAKERGLELPPIVEKKQEEEEEGEMLKDGDESSSSSSSSVAAGDIGKGLFDGW